MSKSCLSCGLFACGGGSSRQQARMPRGRTRRASGLCQGWAATCVSAILWIFYSITLSTVSRNLGPSQRVTDWSADCVLGTFTSSLGRFEEEKDKHLFHTMIGLRLRWLKTTVKLSIFFQTRNKKSDIFWPFCSERDPYLVFPLSPAEKLPLVGGAQEPAHQEINYHNDEQLWRGVIQRNLLHLDLFHLFWV